MVTTAPSRGLHVIRRAGELEGGTRDGLSRSGQQVGVEPDMNRERERERGDRGMGPSKVDYNGWSTVART